MPVDPLWMSSDLMFLKSVAGGPIQGLHTDFLDPVSTTYALLNITLTSEVRGLIWTWTILANFLTVLSTP